MTAPAAARIGAAGPPAEAPTGAEREAAIAALYRSLAAEPWRFDFFQAMRRLECAHRDRPRWGESKHLDEDSVRLTQEPSLAFAPSTLAAFAGPEEDRAASLAVLFFGLFGPHGPLPLHLTEFARDRLRNAGDPTLARFADVFHHRMLSLFYRAWANGEPAVHHDRPAADRFAGWVGSLFGMGSPTLFPTGGLPETTLLHHAGIMAATTRNAEGLSGMLADYLGVPARVETFVGHWIELPAEAPCRLGVGANARLGVSATVGTRVWDCQHKFRVVLGPVNLADYRRLLPGSATLESTTALVSAYVGHELAWDVNILLKKEEIPPLELGLEGQLGWTTWLKGKPATRDSTELVLDPLARAA